MKDAKGHGSNTYNAATAAVVPAHQRGVAQATARTADEYIQAGGKIPTEVQYADLERTNSAYIAGWGTKGLTDFGKAAVARLQAALEQSRAHRAKYGSEENPTAYTLKLRSAK